MGSGTAPAIGGAAGQTGDREGCTRQPTFGCAPLTRRAMPSAGKRRGGREISALAGWTPPIDGVLCPGEGIFCGQALCFGAGGTGTSANGRGSGADGRQGRMRADTSIRGAPWTRRATPCAGKRRGGRGLSCACRSGPPSASGVLCLGKDLLTRWKLFAPSDEATLALDVAAPRGTAGASAVTARPTGPAGGTSPAGRFKARRCG